MLTLRFEQFGDRVKFCSPSRPHVVTRPSPPVDAPVRAPRLTHNEPWCISILGHGRSVFTPGRSSDRVRSPEGDSSAESWILLAAQRASARRGEDRKLSADGSQAVCARSLLSPPTAILLLIASVMLPMMVVPVQVDDATLSGVRHDMASVFEVFPGVVEGTLINRRAYRKTNCELTLSFMLVPVRRIRNPRGPSLVLGKDQAPFIVSLKTLLYKLPYTSTSIIRIPEPQFVPTAILVIEKVAMSSIVTLIKVRRVVHNAFDVGVRTIGHIYAKGVPLSFVDLQLVISRKDISARGMNPRCWNCRLFENYYSAQGWAGMSGREE
ncbi:uncharacterized protein BXZ73DRAFT_82648 [Epithele typhae]|uniref:uncharacterized protein n=1 Tax=Epithele typhae TaxID=378194 RepID=UPI0020079183|nr:uncharacterized protein BXZ73DRAFT_82648 [Epithele typhae]KAH9911728.1 hypothetical protein BXZ73DRAFT_82648 [Epithele typhae]